LSGAKEESFQKERGGRKTHPIKESLNKPQQKTIYCLRKSKKTNPIKESLNKPSPTKNNILFKKIKENQPNKGISQ